MGRFRWFRSGRGGRVPRRSQPRSPRLRRLARFERLESRLALSCTAVVDGGVLLIEGDDAANTIDVSIVGDAVTIKCDDNSLDTTLTGFGSDFNEIKIDGKGGDDAITVEAGGIPDGQEQDLKLVVDGGDGNDHIEVKLTSAQVPDEGDDDGDADEPVDQEGDQDDDDVPPVSDEDGDDDAPPVTDEDEDDDGDAPPVLDEEEDDDADVPPVSDEDADADAPPILDEGDDDGDAPPVTDEDGRDDHGAPPVSDDNDEDHAAFDLRLDGGDGNDTLSLTVQGLTVHENAEVKGILEGGDGDDALTLVAENVEVNGKASLETDGGEGDDSLNVTATDISINGKAEAETEDVESLTTDLEIPPATLGANARVDVDVD